MVELTGIKPMYLESPFHKIWAAHVNTALSTYTYVVDFGHCHVIKDNMYMYKDLNSL